MRSLVDRVVEWVGPDEGWATWVLLLAGTIMAVAVLLWVTLA